MIDLLYKVVYSHVCYILTLNKIRNISYKQQFFEEKLFIYGANDIAKQALVCCSKVFYLLQRIINKGGILFKINGYTDH